MLVDCAKIVSLKKKWPPNAEKLQALTKSNKGFLLYFFITDVRTSYVWPAIRCDEIEILTYCKAVLIYTVSVQLQKVTPSP